MTNLYEGTGGFEEDKHWASSAAFIREAAVIQRANLRREFAPLLVPLTPQSNLRRITFRLAASDYWD
jgi:hypothetical protein